MKVSAMAPLTTTVYLVLGNLNTNQIYINDA